MLDPEWRAFPTQRKPHEQTSLLGEMAASKNGAVSASAAVMPGFFGLNHACSLQIRHTHYVYNHCVQPLCSCPSHGQHSLQPIWTVTYSSCSLRNCKPERTSAGLHPSRSCNPMEQLAVAPHHKTGTRTYDIKG